MMTNANKVVLQILLVIYLIKLCNCKILTQEDLVKLASTDIQITKDNIFDPCFEDGFCFFLGPGFKPPHTTTNDIFIDKVNHTICHNRTEFCMKINIKPMDKLCNKYVVDIGAINVQNSRDWIAVAFKRDDNQMVNNLLVYCKGRTIHRGTIENRNTLPGNVGDKKKWSPDWEGKNSSYDASEKFMRCTFIAPRRPHAFNVRMIDFSQGDTYLLMAQGVKHDGGTTDLQNSEKHRRGGHTEFKLSKMNLGKLCPPAAEAMMLKATYLHQLGLIIAVITHFNF